MKDKKNKGGFEVDIADQVIAEALKSVEKHSKPKDGEIDVELPTDKTAKPGAPEGEIQRMTTPAPENAASKSAAAEGEKGEYYDRLVRVSADFDNFRKRTLREKDDLRRYGAETFIRAFLPTIDNLERAIRLCPEGEATASIRDGLRLVLDQMYRNMQAEGVTPLDPMGQPFDPLLHEALGTRLDADKPPQTVVEVHHKGFKLWDRLLRPALVTVSTQQKEE